MWLLARDLPEGSWLGLLGLAIRPMPVSVGHAPGGRLMMTNPLCRRCSTRRSAVTRATASSWTDSLMWTVTTRAQHKRDGLRFASDLTDAEWAVVKPLLPPPSAVGRPPEWPMRELVNAIFYVLRGGRAAPIERSVTTSAEWLSDDITNFSRESYNLYHQLNCEHQLHPSG